MTDYKTLKEAYSDLPKYLKPIFWITLIIVLLIGYYNHQKACNMNKQDEFLFCFKCYPKPDTVVINKTEYIDTCLNMVTGKNVNTAPNYGSQNIGDHK